MAFFATLQDSKTTTFIFEMSNDLSLIQARNYSFLVGSIPFESDPIPVVVVIVDDNSGSMRGARAPQCTVKTKCLVRECVKKNIEYQYAT
jgi:hypothetical protein